MAYNGQRTPIHHTVCEDVRHVTDSPSSHTNPKFQHQYSELLLATTDSECSATYTMPAYASSDGSHATYSTTTGIYHQPNCRCHMVACQPPQCISPAHQSIQSGGSSSGSSSNPMALSCTKEVWVSAEKERVEPKVDRLNQPIAWIWASVSLSLFILCTSTLTQSSWLVNGKTSETLGLIKQCRRDIVSDQIECQYYAGLPLLQLPSISWKLTFIFFCIADTLLGLSTLLALGASLLTTAKTRRYISFFTGYVQLFAAILFTTAVLFYMVGLDSVVVKETCGHSKVFQTGECQIGWSYLLLIISSSLCFLLPVLSHYIDHTLCTKPEKMEPPEYVA